MRRRASIALMTMMAGLAAWPAARAGAAGHTDTTSAEMARLQEEADACATRETARARAVLRSEMDVHPPADAQPTVASVGETDLTLVNLTTTPIAITVVLRLSHALTEKHVAFDEGRLEVRCEGAPGGVLAWAVRHRDAERVEETFRRLEAGPRRDARRWIRGQRWRLFMTEIPECER